MRSKRERDLADEKSEDEEDITQVPTSRQHNPRTRRTSQASAKVMKEISPHSTFVRGNIIRIIMKNFLTFSNTIVKPGPRLNLIIGPNGTGKSSIINAVCIVFNGKLALLGRGGDLPSFVRHGADQATVEVWVHDLDRPAGNCKVKRIFNIEGSSTFYIDDAKVTGKAITQLTRDYDVQLDNLSQFMPQEKIADFVSIKPPEMLTITVRSLGGTERVESLSKLREQDVHLRKEASQFDKRQEELEGLRQRNDEIKAEVAAFKKQKDLKKRVRLAERILPHREADELRNNLIELVDARKEAEAVVNELKDKLRDIERGTLRQLDLKRKAAKQEVKAEKENVKKANQTLTESTMTIDSIDIKIAQAKNQLISLDNRLEKHESKLRAAEQKVKSYDARIAQLGPTSNEEDDRRLAAEEKEKKNNLRQDKYTEEQEKVGLDQKISSIQSNMRHIENNLKNLSDVRMQRLHSLDRHPRFRNTVRTYNFVSSLMERNVFRGNIFGPLALEISCTDTYHARIMESCVSGWLMGAYVAENSHDARLLKNECQRTLNHAPDVITVPVDQNGDLDEHALSMQVPVRPVDEELRNLGIVAMVPNIFQAHDSVRSALNAQAQLHNIYVGDKSSEENIDRLKNEHGVKVWYTPDTRVQVVTSRYDRNARNLKMDTKFKDIRGQMYYGSSDEVDRERERLNHQLHAEDRSLKETQQLYQEVMQRIGQVSAQIRQVENCERDIFNRIRTRQRLTQDKKYAFAEFTRLQNSPNVDVEKEKKEVKEKLLVLERNMVAMIPKTVEVLAELQETMKVLDEAIAKLASAQKNYLAEEGKNSKYETELQEAEMKFEHAKKEAKELKAEWKRKRQEADASIAQEEIQGNLDIVKPWFERDAAWLQGEIERLTGRIQGLASSGPNVLRDYEEREKRISELEKRIETEKENFERNKITFEKEKREFLTWLKQGVAHMRAKFSELYSRFGCAGDLDLHGVDSIDELELRIMVSYRQGAELRPISATSNSGGEKMCCTMLFCFSLLHDHARMPPFVMVDELNQGLDWGNEMKIMKIMFDDAERGTAPQSFVVTPKLLAGLPFQDAAKTHVIFNGKVFGGSVNDE